ncbi:MAG: hypothetical protein EBT36_09490 [Betaproteobacteria bacterium]|jgi:hypothetical protein|nr:hypothetical protein [Betaproteobacteria bacterium]NBP37438.1 hypothetical protein [Betaproteobacteria bacterium]NBQ95555.1 hypothetical protein [Betaproteobacteria bacterium]NBS39505.1 hypothetical protein [Betaproteobacteria bacterium]NBT71615.1 hypothetical protein [Betaproteobacteria bacterium]
MRLIKVIEGSKGLAKRERRRSIGLVDQNRQAPRMHQALRMLHDQRIDNKRNHSYLQVNDYIR